MMLYHMRKYRSEEFNERVSNAVDTICDALANGSAKERYKAYQRAMRLDHLLYFYKWFDLERMARSCCIRYAAWFTRTYDKGKAPRIELPAEDWRSIRYTKRCMLVEKHGLKVKGYTHTF